MSRESRFWWCHPGRWRQRINHSLGWKIVLNHLVLAIVTGVLLVGSARMTMRMGWRETAQPIVQDYADRLTAEIGSPPDVRKADALAQRLHLRIQIDGPVVQWFSGGEMDEDMSEMFSPRRHHHWLLMRQTADGHVIRFGWARRPWSQEPQILMWVTLGSVVVLVGVAYVSLRRLLRPLVDIHEGAERFGQGDFSQPIPVRGRNDLGRLAAQVNTMAESIRQMLDAKRGLLLAISHELRSPLTRARLNAELALPPPGQPVDDEARKAHDALLADLAEMRDLVTELLESERLTGGHAALQPEEVDVASLVQSLDAVASGAVAASLPAGGPLIVQLDRTRVRLALRNLLDNALRHSAGAPQPPTLQVMVDARDGRRQLLFTVRDHGPGVPDDQLPHLTEPFYRADAARQRATGGVGLGLHLCRLVAQAHGGELRLRNAEPGLEAALALPV